MPREAGAKFSSATNFRSTICFPIRTRKTSPTYGSNISRRYVWAELALTELLDHTELWPKTKVPGFNTSAADSTAPAFKNLRRETDIFGFSLGRMLCG